MHAFIVSAMFLTLAKWLGLVMAVILVVLFGGIGITLFLMRNGTVNDGMSDESLRKLMREYKDETSE